MFSIRLCDLAKKINAKLYGDGSIIIHSIASINSAKQGQITFFANNRYVKKLISCKASAIILSKKDLTLLNTKENIAKLIVKDVYVAYAYVAQFINSSKKNIKSVIDPNSFISSHVNFGKNVSVGKYSVIESGVLLEDNVVISSGCFIGRNSKIKSGTKCSENVTIHHETIIGEKCLIQSGAVIGSDGFGYAKDQEKWIKIPHFGKVIIGNRVEIGSCTTIDRGSLDNTYICDGVIIDNQCQIAHNVYIGENTAIAGGTIIAGGITIGKNCMIGGASVINGHISICENTIITGMSMIIRSIKKSGIYSSGVPAQHNKVWRKNAVLMMNINKIHKRIKILESIFKSFIYKKNQ